MRILRELAKKKKGNIGVGQVDGQLHVSFYSDKVDERNKRIFCKNVVSGKRVLMKYLLKL